MSVFAFTPDPTADAFTAEDYMEQARLQPFSMASTAGQTILGTVLESSLLGTLIRDKMTPEGRVNKNRKMMQAVNPGAFGLNYFLEPFTRPVIDSIYGDQGLETDEELRARGEVPISKEAYPKHPNARPDIQWSPAMTESRLAALTPQSDARALREEMAKRRPWTSLAASFAGSAFDPINYVPIFGEARIGATIADRALRSGADAAANAGVFGLLSAPARAQYGDDTSFDAQVSQMAMAAAIGAGFGAVGGVLARRAEARETKAAAIRQELETRLSTIRNGQDAMASLQEAAVHLADTGEVRLGDASLDRIEGMAAQAADAFPETAARIMETPAAYAARLLDETMPDEMRALREQESVIASNEAALADLRAESMDNDRFRDTRAAFIEAKQLDEKFQRLTSALEKASNKDKVKIQGQLDGIQKQVEALFSKLDPATVDRLDYLDTAIPMRRQALSTAQRARSAAAEKVEARRAELQSEFLSRPPEPAPAPVERPATVARHVVGVQPAPERVAPEVTRAAARVGKTEAPKAIAEHHKVDAETGAFPEEFELAQVEKEGRLTAEDRRVMEAANENFERGRSWGEALRAAAACLI